MEDVAIVDESDVPLLRRRGFLRGGAALLLGFCLPKSADAMLAMGELPAAGAMDAAAAGFDGFVPDGFIRIGKDGRIIFVVPSSEMGQGIATTEAMLIAEELEVGLDQVEVALAPPDLKAYGQKILNNQMTGGSTSVRAFYEPLRRAGAAARQILVESAAEHWSVAAMECRASRATVYHDASGRSATYASLVEMAKGRPLSNAPPALKKPSEFRVIGQSLKRVDTPEKVDGSARFGIDVVVDGMKYAAIQICPTIGGRLKEVDDSAARKSHGVRDILQTDDSVAVVADDYWSAKKGLDLLLIEWDYGPNSSLSSSVLWDDLKRSKAKPLVAKSLGDPDSALSSGIRIEASYELPYLAHAALEPINTTIHVKGDSCELWVSTQVPVDAQSVTAEILGLPPEKVTVHCQLIGGGFGRRLAVDTIQHAARLAKNTNYPVKFIWTREQDIQHDRFRPAYFDRVVATLDETTRMPKVFHHRTTGTSVLTYFLRKPFPEGQLDSDLVAGSVNMPYEIPAGKWEWLRQESPVPVNWWRGVGEGHNVFVVESFMDELALAAGLDPVAFRRKLLGNNHRALGVLNQVTEMANWGQPLPDRHGRGISLHQCFGSFAALVVEVSVDNYGEVSLKRLACAVDCGVAINPDSVVAQIQGGVLFGLSAALYNGVTFKNGRVMQSNFHDYRQLRINEVPPFEVFVFPSTENPGGMGEVGTASAAPALTNAIYSATGVRLRATPVDRTLLAKKGFRDIAPRSLASNSRGEGAKQ